MRKLYFLFFTLLITSLSFGQTTVFQESFETGNSGTSSETCNDGFSDFFTRTDGSDISTGYSVTGMDGTFFFAAQDTDGSPCTSPVETLTFTGINIATFSNMTFAVLIAEDDASDGNEDWDADTNVLIEINIDGAGYTNLLQFSGGGATNTEPGLDTDFDGTADGTLLSSSFQEFTALVGTTGTSADIRITFNNLNAGDEDIAIDNIRIIDGFVSQPTVTITSPADFSVFAPGTTNVDIVFTTVNTQAGDQVDITVNGTTTTDVSSPFNVATTDGQSYIVRADIISGGSSVDFEEIDFSVSTLNQVTDIAALRADVTANGAGSFYEITGTSLVTHTDGFNNRQWIQDSNISGILIFDASNISTTYTVGDNVTGLKGSTTISNGILRFIPTEDSGVIASSGNTVTPQVITIADFNVNWEDYESELVELQNVTFAAGDGTATFATGTNYDVTDGANTVVKRTDFFSADYIGSIIPSTQLPSLVAIAGEFNGTAQIYARSLSDLTLRVERNAINGFSLFPNPVTDGILTINTFSNADKEIHIFDILGKQVLSTNLKGRELNVSKLNSGIYILKILEEGKTATRKLVIK